MWHDIARRLQHASPAPRQPIGTMPDAANPPDTEAIQGPVPHKTDDTAARVGV